MYEPKGISWCEYPNDWYEWRQEVAYFEEQPNFIPEPEEEVKTVKAEPTAEEIAQREAHKLYVECHRD
jgi:hypothetical protein